MLVKKIKHDAEDKMKKAITAVRREFAEVRTGRAHPGLIEGMHVNYYGTPTLLKQIASISIPDSKTIVIQPWDQTAISEIEKTILSSKLGVTPINDGKFVRINIPPLSDERRQELSRVVKDMAEHGRISLRTIRRDANDKVKKMKQDKQVSEDDSFRAQDEIQKLVDKYTKEIDQVLEEKQRELVEHK